MEGGAKVGVRGAGGIVKDGAAPREGGREELIRGGRGGGGTDEVMRGGTDEVMRGGSGGGTDGALRGGTIMPGGTGGGRDEGGRDQLIPAGSGGATRGGTGGRDP